MSTILIDITPPGGSTEDITNKVIASATTFTSLVNGAPGDCTIRVKDTGHTESYVSGSVIRLWVDGGIRWGGYLMKATRTWPFPVEPTVHPQQAPRYIDLVGVDYNILFQKRIVRHLTTPANPISKLYAPGTYDDTILLDVVNNYTDLAADGITNAISRISIAILDVGGITIGGKRSTGGVVWNAGDKVFDAFASVARATSGIYYITPTKVLTYCDVDSPTSSYTLTDTPASGTDVGYRELRLTEMGDSLVNDALVWGAALGADHMVFQRVQDSASIALHGQWQAGNFSTGLYKSASALFVANTMVNGTPSSKRGAKDDKRSFEAKVVGAKFNVGDKVDCISGVWGFNMVLPVRRVVYTFPTTRDVFQQLTLSYEVDQPFDIYESLFPGFGIGPIGTIPNITITGGGPSLPPSSGVCTPVMFDTFLDRVTTGTFGNTSGDGRLWITDFAGFTSYGVSFFGVHSGAFVQHNGGAGPQSGQWHATQEAADPWTTGADISFQVIFSFTGVLGGDFEINISGPNCNVFWLAGTGQVGVDDAGNNWFDSFAYTFALNTDYVMEGYCKNTIGSGCRVYKVGDPAPAWVFPSAGSGVGGPTAEFAYDDGSVAGLADSSNELFIEVDGVPNPSVYFWKNLTIASGCVIGTGSGSASVSLTGYVIETGIDTGTHQIFTVSRSITPGSTQVTIDGIVRHDYTEQTNAGTITFTAPLPAGTSAPVIKYIAALPPSTGAWASKPAFLSYPSSAALNYVGYSTDIEVSGKSFTGNTYSTVALRFENCTGNIWIHDCDFDSNQWDALNFITSSGNLIVEWCRFGAFTTSSHGGRLYPDVMQWDKSHYTGTFRNNKIKLNGYHEDILSFYQSGGPSSSARFEVAFNAIEGGLPISSGSGTGSLLGDNTTADGHIWVHDNTYLNPGQVGIGISEGIDIHVTDNIVYGQQATNSNVGIYTPYVGGSPNPGGHEVARNRVWFKNAAGSLNSFFNGGASGPVAGLSPQTNTFDDTTINPADLVVTL